MGGGMLLTGTVARVSPDCRGVIEPDDELDAVYFLPEAIRFTGTLHVGLRVEFDVVYGVTDAEAVDIYPLPSAFG
jgi:cold shock CspA family protein